MIRLIYFEILRFLRSHKIFIFITGLYVCILLSLPSLDSSYSVINFSGITGLRNSTWISTLSVMLASFYMIIFGFYFFKGYFSKDIKTDKYQNFKSSSTLFRIILNKTLAFVVFGCIVNILLIAVILIMQGASGTLSSFSLSYQWMLIFRYMCPVIIFICIVTLLFDLLPILNTKIGGFIYIFVFIAVILNENRGNHIQFSPLYSMFTQMSKSNGSSSVGYSIITDKSAVNYVQLLPLKFNFSEAILFNFVLVGVLLSLILIISKFWGYSNKEKRMDSKYTINKDDLETLKIIEGNKVNDNKIAVYFTNPVKLLSHANQILHIVRVELHLLFSKCKKSIMILTILYLLWLIMGGFFIDVMPFVFPIFMLPSLLFLIEYPKLYETQDLMYSVRLKQFNKTVRIIIMLTLILLYMPIVIRSNLAYFNFSHSFLMASTGALLLVSIAFYFINAKHNYFEGLFLCLWYLGILNKVPYFDIFFGVNATNKYNQVIFNVLLLFLVMTINLLHPILMKMLRKVSL